jgi:transcriptional regulator with XRE-family HTH domain
MPRGKTEIDTYVSRRIARARVEGALSQERLGAALGVTFQQAQKICSGINRVSAGQLYKIAKATGKSFDWFYEGLPANGDARTDPEVDITMAVASTRDGLALIRAFSNIPSRAMRQAILQVAEAAAEGDVP